MSFEQYRPQKKSLFPPVVKNLLIINVLVYAAKWVAETKYGIDLANYLGLHYYTSQYFKPYQFITYMFMHGSPDHIFFNMFALWMFGNQLENLWGAKRFIIFYFITGVGAALLYLGYEAYQYNHLQHIVDTFSANPNPTDYLSIFKDHFSGYWNMPENQREVMQFTQDWGHHLGDAGYSASAIRDFNQLLSFQVDAPMVGASGAIFGILVGFGMLFPNTELYLMFIPIPVKAKYAVILYAAIELFLGVAQFSGDNIAHFAHLGGALVGFIIIKYWQKNSNRFY